MDSKGELSFRQFVWLWNRYQGLQTPPLHMVIAEWLGSEVAGSDRRLLLMVFRSAGKSTLVGILCAWLLLRDSEIRILVLAAEHDLARKMVRNVKRIIERHPLTRHLVPGRAEPWTSDQFTVRRRRTQRDPSLLAKGISSNVTGSRADVVICDDVEVPNTCATAAKRQELRERLGEIAYVLVPGGTQLYVGTPHSYYSIYAQEPRLETGESLPFLAGFRCLQIPLLDAQGQSRWPERFPPERIDEIKTRTGPAKFESQMLLRPRSEDDTRLDPDRLVPYRDELRLQQGNGERALFIGAQRMASAIGWWDPAFGAPTRGDRSVVAAVFVDTDGHYWLHGIRYLRHDPGLAPKVAEATQLCREVASFARTLHLPTLRVETNGIGRFLPALLRREIETQGGSCSVVEHVSTTGKDQRILDAFDPVLAAGALRAHVGVWETPFVQEMRTWRPGRRSQDDGLDAVSGCLLAEPVRLPRRPPAGRSDWRTTARARIARSEFEI